MSMCHERWANHSAAAVERNWIRSLSQRDRDEERTALQPREQGESEERPEPVGAAPDR
jgi:hypothetical protein